MIFLVNLRVFWRFKLGVSIGNNIGFRDPCTAGIHGIREILQLLNRPLRIFSIGTEEVHEISRLFVTRDHVSPYRRNERWHDWI